VAGLQLTLSEGVVPAWDRVAVADDGGSVSRLTVSVLGGPTSELTINVKSLGVTGKHK
jgi:hypothetical protein